MLQASGVWAGPRQGRHWPWRGTAPGREFQQVEVLLDQSLPSPRMTMVVFEPAVRQES